MGFHDITVKDSSKKDFPLSQLKGKHVLIVNVASRCGYTPQYKGLQALYEKMKPKGVEVLGFPCNQFGAQEPGTEEEIVSFCDMKYGVKFPIMAKSDVNGPNTNEVYKFIKSQKPGDVKWNFEKVLIDGNGNVVERFGSGTTPAQLEQLLASKL